VGGVTPGADGRDGEGKALIVIAAEVVGNGIGRIRMSRRADASTPSLHGFIQQAISVGSTVRTDGWAPYKGLEKLGYGHEPTPLKGKGKGAAVELLPRVHRVAALLKRWLLGTHQGAVTISINASTTEGTTPAPATGAVVRLLLEHGVGAPGPDRFLSPEIETAVGLVSSGAVLSAVEEVIGELA
jgi:hypothetical protein